MINRIKRAIGWVRFAGFAAFWITFALLVRCVESMRSGEI